MITYDIEKLKTLSKFIKEILEVCSRSLLKKFLHNLLNTYTCILDPCMYLCLFVNTYIEHEPVLYQWSWLNKEKIELNSCFYWLPVY